MRPVYWFEEAKEDVVKYIGTSGWRIGQLSNLEIPSAPGFILSSDFSNGFNDPSKIDKLKTQLLKHLVSLEKTTGKKIDSETKPLILSLYPSHYDEMIDGIEPILNIGLNDETVLGLSTYFHRPKFAYLTYIRFVSDFLEQILDVDFQTIEKQVKSFMAVKRVEDLVSLEIADLKELTKILKNISIQIKKIDFPNTTLDQFEMIIAKKVKQWNDPKLEDYRKSIGFDSDRGLALIVREQKFSNLGEDSADIKILTRNPETGVKELIITGRHNWQRYSKLPFRKSYTKFNLVDGSHELKIREYVDVLEMYYNNALELNLLIEDKKIFINQVKPLKKSPTAEFKIAMELANETKKNLKITSENINLENTERLFNKLIEVSPSSRSICKVSAFSNTSVAGRLTTDPMIDLESKILVVTDDNLDFYNNLNSVSALLSLAPERTFRTILEAKRRGLPCFSTKELKIDDSVLRTDSGISIRNGAGVTLCHYTGEMYAGELPYFDPKIKADVTEFHDQINLELVENFSLLISGKGDLRLIKELSAKEIVMDLDSFGEYTDIGTLRSEIKYVINQNPSTKFVFKLKAKTVQSDLGALYGQVSALVESVISCRAFDRVELVLAGADNHLEYKMLLDWLSRNLDTECKEGLEDLKKRFLADNLLLLSSLESFDKRYYGVYVDLFSILKSIFGKNTCVLNNEFVQNVYFGHVTSHVRDENELNEYIVDKIKTTSQILNTKLESRSMLNKYYARKFSNIGIRSFVFDEKRYSGNKILFFLVS